MTRKLNNDRFALVAINMTIIIITIFIITIIINIIIIITIIRSAVLEITFFLMTRRLVFDIKLIIVIIIIIITVIAIIINNLLLDDAAVGRRPLCSRITFVGSSRRQENLQKYARIIRILMVVMMIMISSGVYQDENDRVIAERGIFCF